MLRKNKRVHALEEKMFFEKACIDLCYEEQGSSLSVLQSDTTFFLSDCCRSQFLTVVSFLVHLPGGVLLNSHAEQTYERSAARLCEVGQLNPTNSVIPSSNPVKVFCEYDPPIKTHSVHLQRRPNRKEYYSASCLSCTISTGGDWGYFHTCFSVAYKKTKTWLGDIRIQYICTASMCLYTDPSWLLSKDELSSEQRQHHSQQSDALEKRYK